MQANSKSDRVNLCKFDAIYITSNIQYHTLDIRAKKRPQKGRRNPRWCIPAFLSSFTLTSTLFAQVCPDCHPTLEALLKSLRNGMPMTNVTMPHPPTPPLMHSHCSGNGAPV